MADDLSPSSSSSADPGPSDPNAPPLPASTATSRRRLRLGLVRRRAVALGVVAVVVVTTGSLLSAVGVRGAPAAGPYGPRTGAFFCPHGGAAGWKGWIVVTNPGRRAVRVRLVRYGPAGILSTAAYVVPPKRQIYLPASPDREGASSAVEFFGGWVGVSAVIRSEDAIAAARCVTARPRTWFVPDGSTGEGESSYLVVMNPFAQDAAFNVILRTERRSLRPGPLTPFVVPAGSSAAIKLNSFALMGPGERSLGAQVVPVIGRVVVGGLGVSEDGVRAEAGVPAATVRSVIPVTGYGDGNEVVALAPGDRPSDLLVITQGPQEQTTLGVGDLRVEPDRVRTISVEDLPGVGLVVESTNGVPVAVARRVAGAKGDVATVAGSTRTARAWLVPPTVAPVGGSSQLVVENPGEKSINVTITLIGGDGVVQAASPATGTVPIPAGRTVAIRLSPTGAGPPLTALVVSRDGTFVASAASYSLGGAGYAATLGIPLGQS